MVPTVMFIAVREYFLGMRLSGNFCYNLCHEGNHADSCEKSFRRLDGAVVV